MKRVSLVTIIVLMILIMTAGAALASVLNYRAHLAGKYVIPVELDTKAQGQATFNLNADGTEMSYKLNVANIDNVFMAHIHLKSDNGGPGPIVVWLYPQTPFAPSQTDKPASFIEGRFDGVLAEGTFTAADLKGPLAGKTMSDLLQAIENGKAYVNVHTNDFVPPLNSGPGDFFPGEIQGHIH